MTTNRRNMKVINAGFGATETFFPTSRECDAVLVATHYLGDAVIAKPFNQPAKHTQTHTHTKIADNMIYQEKKELHSISKNTHDCK